MLRLSIAARVTLTVLIALTALWIVVISLFYRNYGLERPGGDDVADRVAAIVELVENTPGAQRPLVLRAVNSDLVDVRFAPASDLAVLPAPARRVGNAAALRFDAALGGRRNVVATLPSFPAQRAFPAFFSRVADTMRFNVALKTGETLIVETRNAVLLNRIGLPVGIGAGLFGTLIALVALLIMHRETRPLARLAAAADRMNPADDPVLLPQARRSAPEIRALIDAFNRMQLRLWQLSRARMAMLGGISHDVRTFATRLRLRVDLIADETQRERAVDDIADMIRLLDDALLASRAGAGELKCELVDFAEIVRTEVEDRRAAGGAIDWRMADGLGECMILGDRVALRRIVSNLADNALKYGGAAHLALVPEAGLLVLTVDDEGSGFAPEQRELLLEPFVRNEVSRNRRTGGAGLGLAVVRNLVEALGGSIELGEAPGGGGRACVRLPLFAQ